MGSIIWFMLLSVMVIGCTCASTRNLVIMDIMDLHQPMDNKIPTESGVSIALPRNEQLCTLCQEFTAQAVEYLAKKETQSQIISSLHHACSHLHSLKQQCIQLVDYYAPLFFVEIATISADQFCEKMNLCEDIVFVPQPKRDDACTICHRVIDEALTKLEDPDTQLEIIEVLLKGCSKVENFAKECKRLVLEYGPLILANTEKFLETKDICVAIHACKASKGAAAVGQEFLSA